MNEIQSILITTIIMLLIMLLISLYIRRLFNEVRNTKCYYCNEIIGKEYDYGEARYKEIENDELLWSHTRCIPEIRLKYWRKTY